MRFAFHKHRLLVRLLIVLSAWVTTAFAAQPEPATTSSAELRAVWASTLSPCMNSPGEIRDLVAAVRRANMNTIIAQVRHRGITYYDSKIEPRAPAIRDQAGFDPLADLLREAHDTSGGKQRLDVYAWFNVFNFGKVEGNEALTAAQRKRIPQWLSLSTTGTKTSFLDPAIPAVQDYLLSLIAECLEKYDIDGVNLDYIRYPEEEAGYHPTAVARFHKLSGGSGIPNPDDAKWNAFRRAQVNGFVRRCAAMVWKTKPDVLLTVCATGFGGPSPDGDFTKMAPYKQVQQDWAGWAREGSVDIVTRMGYKREFVPAHAKMFRDWADLSHRLQEGSEGRLVTLGIGGFLNTLEGTLEQYRVAQRLGHGTSLFSYWRPLKDSDTSKTLGAESPFWAELAKSVYQAQAAPPRPDWRKSVGVVSGRAVDPAGKPLDGVKVVLSGAGMRELPSDGGGWFVFVNLKPGEYTLKVNGATVDGKKVTVKAGAVEELKF